jgi:protein-disulfide isomerase
MLYFPYYPEIAYEYMSEETQTHYQSAPRQSLGIPVAIVIAAALVAGAIIYTGSTKSSPGTQIVGGTGQVEQQTPEVEIAPVTAKDHILGNPNAPIVIVEYSDYDCPFCKNFHETMHRIMDEYGEDGKVAWVYRHFPLTQLHPNAKKIAEAAECVASIGGNDAFWTFSDFVFSERGTNEPTDMAKLPEFAERSGVSKATYTQCMDTGKFTAAIEDAVTAALGAGAQGTPYSILVAGDQQGPINGAQPYATVKQMIDTLLAQAGAQ